MVAAKIPYEETKKISIALPVFSNFLIVLDEKAFLDKYYTLQSTLHGLSFYEGILNEEATVLYIKEVEDLLKEAQRIIKKASKIDASKLLEIAKLRLKIKSEILSKSLELINLRNRERAIIDDIKTQLSS